MTGDEMERAIEFILQQQARFEVSAQQKIEAILDQQAKNASDIMQLRALGAKLAKSQLRTERRLAESRGQLAEQLAESHRLLAESHRELTESQKATEDSLRSVLKALERGFGGNGRGRKTS